MRYIFIVLSVVIVLAAPLLLSAATLEEIDQHLSAAETPEELLKIEALIRESMRQQPVEMTWRLAKTYFKLGKEAGRATRRPGP